MNQSQQLKLLYMLTCVTLIHILIKFMRVCDALHHAKHQYDYAYCVCEWDMRSMCQKLCAAGLVVAQRTVQNNGNMKSELIPG